MQSADFNPFAAPVSTDTPEVIDPEAEAIRRAHLVREAEIRAIARVGQLISVLFGLLALSMIFLISLPFLLDLWSRGGNISGPLFVRRHRPILPGILLFAICSALSFAFFASGRGLLRFRRWARGLWLAFSVLMLSYLLIGGLLFSYAEDLAAGVGLAFCSVSHLVALKILLSREAREIFSPAYREILSRAPGAVPRLSAGSWLWAGVTILTLSIGMFILIRWT